MVYQGDVPECDQASYHDQAGSHQADGEAVILGVHPMELLLYISDTCHGIRK